MDKNKKTPNRIFAPLNTPLQRRLQVMAEAAVVFTPIVIGLVGIFLSIILLKTKLWFLPLFYFGWMLLIDKDTPEKGGRRIEWICNWKLFKYARDYYPITLSIDPDVKLDAKRNYLFCSFPHGVLAKGALSSIVLDSNNFSKLYPFHSRHFFTLDVNFKVPFYRDFMLATGGCSSSAKSINYILAQPNGGNIAVLVVGGAAEGLYAHPGPYHLVLKNRKGFVKLALRNGSPLVPVFSFGENELFKQVNNPEGSLLRNFQEWVKSKLHFSPIVVYGRGLLQYSFGLIPLRNPINVVVGKPIEVKRTENPSQEDIDSLHARFIGELTRLFDEHKHKFVEHPEDNHLIIV